MADTEIAVDMRPRWKRQVQRVRHDPWGIVVDFVGDRRYGSQRGHVPTDGRRAIRESRHDGTALVAFVANDGFELLLCRMYPHRTRECMSCPVHPGPETRGRSISHRNDHEATCVPAGCPDHESWAVDADRVEGTNYGLSRAESRWLARFILGWMAADGFGLRRAIYYYALHRHVAGYGPPK